MRGEEKVEARRLSHAPFAGFYGNRNRKVNFISTIRREQNSEDLPPNISISLCVTSS